MKSIVRCGICGVEFDKMSTAYRSVTTKTHERGKDVETESWLVHEDCAASIFAGWYSPK